MSLRPVLVAWGALCLVVALTGAARAGTNGHETGNDFDRNAALSHSQSAIGRELGGYRLLDRDGRPVSLSDLRGQPLLISMIYTSCAHTCPIVTQTLDRAVDVARNALGADSFRVATIGFDTPRDTPERMGIFAREQGIDTDGWLFLSADETTVGALSEDLGFVYFRSPKGFDHITQTTVLDRDGRVVRQIYGEGFEPPSLVEPLKALALAQPLEAETLSGLIERVRLFCTVYDPAQDRYRFDYSLIVAFMAGAASLGAVAIFLARAWRQHRAQRPAI